MRRKAREDTHLNHAGRSKGQLKVLFSPLSFVQARRVLSNRPTAGSSLDFPPGLYSRFMEAAECPGVPDYQDTLRSRTTRSIDHPLLPVTIMSCHRVVRRRNFSWQKLRRAFPPRSAASSWRLSWWLEWETIGIPCRDSVPKRAYKWLDYAWLR